MQTYGSGGIAPRIIKLDNRWRCVVSVTLQLFYSEETLLNQPQTNKPVSSKLYFLTVIVRMIKLRKFRYAGDLVRLQEQKCE
jgi:hypothetical protein